MLRHSPLVGVKRVKGKGRGVFALQAIRKGAVIEKVPLFLIPIEHVAGGLKNPELPRYFFLHDRKHVAVPLGFGCVYNHSFKPNARYDDGPGLTKVFTALRDIAAGEEVCINYNWNPRDRSPMIFEVV